jgi:hypothetical protein
MYRRMGPKDYEKLIQRNKQDELDRMIFPIPVVKAFTENISIEDAKQINEDGFKKLREDLNVDRP